MDAEREALSEAVAGLEARHSKLKERPRLEGPAGQALVDDWAALLRDYKALDDRRLALVHQVENWRAEDEPGIWGRAARLHPAAGVACASVVPMMWVLGYLLSERGDPRFGFFQVAAQVLPVLLIAVGLEMRGARSRIPFARALTATTIAWMGVGEAACMWTLATGHVTSVSSALVVSALISAGVTALLLIIFG